MQVEPNGDVTTRACARQISMSLTTTAAVEAGTPPTAPDGPPSTPPSIQELEQRLAAAQDRLAAATAQRDAYRDALVRVRLAMHSVPGV
jgi:hypothetical protein